MMRRSGVRPAVKRSKLACEILRRAASGHIEATQLAKLAAASRIADAVISGWPEAPSSPLQGGGAPLAVGAPCACAEVPVRAADGAVWLPFENVPVKMLSKKLRGPPPDDCARASPHTNSAAARMTAPVRPFAGRLIRRIVFPSHSHKYPLFQKVGSPFPLA